ncbi:ubiquinone biosynthesis regulatory protein kinase UbiB [Zooshikella marina]|uniref:Probable protein kinase UbiB n=1 Tax=Zooshikella ganghwensis TaxID=202772 RepID=A0A4P9VRN5_9GAMM|nr:ubiquinone biosynthesis regulatory protein kinase UbiB [Zooshikella ganghwensis]MBU2708536.1 ubiquinone biosynthesis regulatory protein kinase UbiB [Zooshikella ganghwensis]RDH46258.1 ubiquinone biosynthesis regulatory protein kinase UbiB [Zooshikella ganghwensis]
MVQIPRLLKIIYVTAKYRLDNLIDDAPLPFYLRLAFWCLPWRWFVRNQRPRAERLRLALEELGPIFVKFGQLLSTRRDLLPDDVAQELQKLQDQVPPFASEEAIKIIEASLQQSVTEVFTSFSATPMASASVAQVHAAELPDGQQVVVKVIRPGIQKVIRQDIALLYLLARIIVLISREGRRLRPLEVVQDYENTIFDELDLQREAANASQLRRNFADSDKLYVPQVYWDFTSTQVMVMERIHGIPVANVEALLAQGTNMRKLAERGVEIFFTQVFRDSFFHADMHPGNIFVATEDPSNPCYIAIDCGICGSLTPEDQSYLARNLIAFFKQDYRMVAQLHIDSGWVPKNTRVNELEAAIRTVCEPVFQKPLKDISFGQVLLRLFQTARRFNMEVQPQLVLLQKTLLNIEGLGRQLYPELDLWSTAKPFLEQWMKKRIGPMGLLKSLHTKAPDLLEQAPLLSQTVVKAVEGYVSHQHHYQQQLEEARHKRQRRRIQQWVGCATLAVGLIGLWIPDWYNVILNASEAHLLLVALGVVLLVKQD